MGSRDQQGTKDCTAVVAVLSSALQESTHVATELSLALDYKRPIIPVLREPWEPAEHSEHTHRLKFLLAGRQLVDFSTLGFDEGVETLARAVSAACDREVVVEPREPAPRRRFLHRLLSWRTLAQRRILGDRSFVHWVREKLDDRGESGRKPA
jgi:hypothetical protein